GPPAGEDGDLVHRVGVGGGDAHGDVPGLVHRGGVALALVDEHAAPLHAHQHPVAGALDVGDLHPLRALARGEDGRLVEEVGQLRAGEAGGAAGQVLEVDLVGELDRPGV